MPAVPPERFATDPYHLKNCDAWERVELSEGRLCGGCNIPGTDLMRAKVLVCYKFRYILPYDITYPLPTREKWHANIPFKAHLGIMEVRSHEFMIY